MNATRAYKVAYPRVKNDKVAAAAAARLLRNVNVKKYISEQLEKIHNEKTADAQEVMEYLTAVLRGKSTAHEIVVEGIGDGMTKAKVMEKNPSELLGRRYSLFADKLEVSGLESEQTKLDDLIQQMRGGG